MILADGAMGTELMARTGTLVPAELNLTRPEIVLGLHREYVDAGARLLVANTLMASPVQASAGVSLVREAAPAGVKVAGSLAAVPGRTGASYRELERAMAAADMLLIETVTSLQALGLALQAIQRRPVWVTLSFDPAGLLDGQRPREVVHLLRQLGVDAFGYGCGFGPQAALEALRDLREAAPEAMLIAKPGANVQPTEMGAWARDAAALGVDIIGACCGSAPGHIRAMAAALAPQAG